MLDPGRARQVVQTVDARRLAWAGQGVAVATVLIDAGAAVLTRATMIVPDGQATPAPSGWIAGGMARASLTVVSASAMCGLCM